MGSSRSSRARGSSTARSCRSRRPPPPRTPALLTSRAAQGASRSPAAAASPATSGPASAAEAAAAPAQALEPPPRRTFSAPGSRRFPTRHARRARPQSEGARARGRDGSALEAGMRLGRARLGAGLPLRRGGGGRAAGPRPLSPAGPPPTRRRLPERRETCPLGAPPARSPRAAERRFHSAGISPGQLGAPPDVTAR